jgi:transposase-like protein
MTREEKHEFWSHVLELQQASCLSLKAFCQQEGIKEHQFHYWRRRLGETAKAASHEAAFVSLEFSEREVVPSSSFDLACGISVILGAVRLELSRGFDSEELKRTIRILGTV